MEERREEEEEEEKVPFSSFGRGGRRSVWNLPLLAGQQVTYPSCGGQKRKEVH